jgi:hypothetical protein
MRAMFLPITFVLRFVNSEFTNLMNIFTTSLVLFVWSLLGVIGL